MNYEQIYNSIAAYYHEKINAEIINANEEQIYYMFCLFAKFDSIETAVKYHLSLSGG